LTCSDKNSKVKEESETPTKETGMRIIHCTATNTLHCDTKLGFAIYSLVSMKFVESIVFTDKEETEVLLEVWRVLDLEASFYDEEVA